MKYQTSVVTSFLLALSSTATDAFVPAKHNGRALPVAVLQSAVVDENVGMDTNMESLTNDLISKLRFREVQKELERRALDTKGTLSNMKDRLRESAVGMQVPMPMAGEDEQSTANLDEAFAKKGISFEDTSDPDFDYKNLVKETLEKAEKIHWKGATRKLRQLTRRFGKLSPSRGSIPEDVYMAVLQSCVEDRLHGARAAESARKIMELMVDEGYDIPNEIANNCVFNALSDGPDGTHDGFGGIDTALSMLAAFEHSSTPIVIQEETYAKVAASLAASGSIDESLKMLREMVAEKSLTPDLKVFADVATSCVKTKNKADAEKVMTILAYAKAAGYQLDNMASTVDGRTLLANGVIAAGQLENIGLGLRFLTAAAKAEGCAPDRGDALVSTHSPAAQRAATILHRGAIFKASQDLSWQLSVKLLELMLERGCTPSPAVLNNVVNCCAKAEKSRKATSVLLDWVELHKQGRVDKPSLRMFNTVVNVCEVCGEEELTVRVLDAMKAAHDTEGNLITFNIALKRLAKQGNTLACEGIIVGMLQNGIEPSVVSYTTAIAACASEPKKSEIAVEWIKRMRSRLVQPNVITYNTAFASCLDGTLEGSQRASQLAAELVVDIQLQVDSGILAVDEYTNIIPDFYTRTLARQAMKQLKANWESGAIDKQVAKTTLRVPLLQLVEFMKTDLAALAEKQKDFIKGGGIAAEETAGQVVVPEELEYSTAINSHRAAAV